MISEEKITLDILLDEDIEMTEADFKSLIPSAGPRLILRKKLKVSIFHFISIINNFFQT